MASLQVEVTQPDGGRSVSGATSLRGMHRVTHVIRKTVPFAIFSLEKVKIDLPLVANHLPTGETAHRNNHGMRASVTSRSRVSMRYTVSCGLCLV